MNFGDLIYNWAFALYDLSRSSKKLKEITDEAAEIVRVLKKNKNYLEILNSYNIDDKIKNDLVDEAFSGYNIYIVNTIKLAIKQHYIKYIIFILNKFVELSDNKLNIKYGTIFTTKELKQEEIKKFELKLSKELNSEVHLINEIDESLIGGIKIKVEDYLIDNSIDGHLRRLVKTIK
ncbi:F0F1 ATP synthase subunit delta [Mycoplasma struthionis]|uniref:ATP synthase subunit delta n=1 Tax=Mycoplasma struthionis TaxID=538220 RepID=A0A502M8X9_9MOLU|nr:F0F1 ATP synthase subunit delta [Mycoplasma struthionis]TPI01938.1 F0F1 ATP synthase subunit delta [Mycoplasma struthionis]